MFDSYLYPTFTKESDSTNYNLKKAKANTCMVCNGNCTNTYTTYVYNENVAIKTCYLCNIIMNFKKYNINKMLLIKTTKSQTFINKNVLQHYSNYRTIPILSDIDKNAKKITNVQTIMYFCNYDKFKNENIKIYFNPNVLNYLSEIVVNLLFQPKIESIGELVSNANVIAFYNNMKQCNIENHPCDNKNKEILLCKQTMNNNLKKNNDTINKKQQLIQLFSAHL